MAKTRDASESALLDENFLGCEVTTQIVDFKRNWVALTLTLFERCDLWLNNAGTSR